MSKKHKKHHKSEKDSDDKPGLKLVLKVGTPDHGDNTPPAEEHEADKKHKHKKKKKKHKHHKDDREVKEKPEKRKSDKLEEMDISDIEEETTSEPPPKRQATEASVTPGVIPGRSLRERKSIEEDQTHLQRCLEYIHKILVRKDLNGFFAFPVTDNIAPSYSKIISSPMDLSTMKEKLDDNEYPTLLEYKADFKLMCDNCMTYNHPETIYYKEAEKMLKYGLKLMSKERMIQLKRSLPFMSLVSDHEMGVDQDQIHNNSIGGGATPKPLTPKPKIKKTIMSKFEAFPDRLTPEQILAQAQDAAKDAAEQLTLRKPRTKFGFLRRREDGSTTLNLLNPQNDGIVSEKERVVNLGTLIGKLQTGTGLVTGFKEDKRNKATPVNYLNYGPFSSFAPVYDSSQANLSKEDTDLLLSAYGDEAGTQYAYSVCHFVKDAGDYAVKMVDNLLDIITGGDHSRARTVLQKVEDAEREEAPPEPDVKQEADDQMVFKEEPVENIDFSALRSLSELGIDVAFVDNLETNIKQEEELQKKLDDTSNLLKDLQQTQYDRLSQTTPQHMAHIKGADEKELQLAEKVTKGLTDLVKQANPHELLSTPILREALGVTTSAQSDNDVDDINGPTVAAADTTTDDIDDISITSHDIAAQPLDNVSDEVDILGRKNKDYDDMNELMDQGSSLDQGDMSSLTPGPDDPIVS